MCTLTVKDLQNDTVGITIMHPARLVIVIRSSTTKKRLHIEKAVVVE